MEGSRPLPSPMQPLRIAAIGAGGGAAAHFEAARLTDAFEIAGVLDIDAERAQAQAARYGIARCYADLAELRGPSRATLRRASVPRTGARWYGSCAPPTRRYVNPEPWRSRSDMDYAQFVKKLEIPDGFVPPPTLTSDDVVIEIPAR